MVNTENPMVNALVTGEQTNQTHGFETEHEECLRTNECNRNLAEFLSSIK